MRALVSASDVVAVLTAHVDRVHDAARRLGCSGDEAFEATQAACAALVDDLAQQPETVGDLVGGLYARAREAATRVRRGGGAPVTYDPAETMLDAAETAQVEAALFDLPERRRLGVLLVDSYALASEQAAIGLGLDAAETARTVALGRLALVADVDGGEPPSLLGHDVAVGDLGQLADGSAPAGGRFATLRRHVSSCAICAEVLAAETRGRALAASLPVHAPSDEDRADILARASSRASTTLLPAAEVQAELAGERADPPLVPGFVIALALTVAVLLGIGLGVLMHGGGNGNAASVTDTPPTGTVAATPTPTRPTTSSSPPPTSSAAPVTTSSAVLTSTSPAAVRTAATVPAAVTLSPTSGPGESVITVRGSGFPPATLITVAYVHRDGETNDQTSTVDGQGRFTVRITADDPSRPTGLLSPPVDNSGPHTVTATDGSTRATATFTQTT